MKKKIKSVLKLIGLVIMIGSGKMEILASEVQIKSGERNCIIPTSVSSISWQATFENEYRNISYRIHLGDITEAAEGKGVKKIIKISDPSRLSVRVNGKVPYQISLDEDILEIIPSSPDEITSGMQEVIIYTEMIIGQRMTYNQYKSHYLDKTYLMPTEVYGKEKNDPPIEPIENSFEDEEESQEEETRLELNSNNIRLIFKEIPQIR